MSHEDQQGDASGTGGDVGATRGDAGGTGGDARGTRGDAGGTRGDAGGAGGATHVDAGGTGGSVVAWTASSEPASAPRASSRLPKFEGHLVASRFEIGAQLAEGGMSRVYVARQRGLDREVAVKFLKPSDDDDWHARFEREGRVLAALSHPNVVTVYECGDHEGYPYLVMELVKGVTLQKELRTARIAGSRVVRLALQIVDGLADCHAHGVVHRDLKPANILLSHRGDRVKVIDFGVAKTERRLDEAQTSAGIRVGSPRYMAPEQIRGEAITGAADIYSLGCVLYAMISGAPPFSSESAIHTMLHHVNSVPEDLGKRVPPGTISPELEAVVMRCIAKSPSERFESMEALSKALLSLPEAAAASPTFTSGTFSGSFDSGTSPSGLLRAEPSRGKGSLRQHALPITVVVTASLALAVSALFLWSRTIAASDASTSGPPVMPAVIPASAIPVTSAPEQARGPAPELEPVMVTLDTEPSGARLEVDGQVVGLTPVVLPVGRNEIVDGTVTLDGFEPMRVRLSAAQPEHRVSLARIVRSRRHSPATTASPRDEPPSSPPPAAPLARVPETHPDEPSPAEPRRSTTTGITDNPDPWSD